MRVRSPKFANVTRRYLFVIIIFSPNPSHFQIPQGSSNRTIAKPEDFNHNSTVWLQAHCFVSLVVFFFPFYMEALLTFSPRKQPEAQFHVALWCLFHNLHFFSRKFPNSRSIEIWPFKKIKGEKKKTCYESFHCSGEKLFSLVLVTSILQFEE